MRAQKGEGPRGRNPPSSFEPKDVTLNGFISIISRESEFKCEICGTLLLGKKTCENHLRSEHFKEFKSLFAKECSLEALNHETYKKWEAEPTFIVGLTFFSLEEREKHALLQKENKKVDFREIPESGETLKIVKESSLGPNIVETERTVLTSKDGEPKKTVIKCVRQNYYKTWVQKSQ